AISRKPRPSDSRRLISAYRSTVNFLRAIATPSASCKTDDGTGPNRHRRRLARGWSQSEEIGWVQFQEIRWSPSQEIGWSQSEEILHEAWLCASSRLVWEALSALSGASRYAVYTSVCSGCSPWKASQSIRGFKRPSNVRPVRLPSTDSRHRTGPRT